MSRRRPPSDGGPPLRPVPDDARFGIGVALVAWVAAFLVSSLCAQGILAATGYASTDQDTWPLWLIGVVQVPLWTCQMGALVVVSRRLGTGDFPRDYRFRVKGMDAVVGIPLGIAAQAVFVPLLYKALWFIDPDKVEESARSLVDRAHGPGIVVLALLVIIGAPVVEELFFRGLLMRAIQARYNDSIAIVLSAVLFAAAHFQTYQFPALVMFGLLVAYLAQRSGRLGPSIFCHVGFNLYTVLAIVFDWRSI